MTLMDQMLDVDPMIILYHNLMFAAAVLTVIFLVGAVIILGICLVHRSNSRRQQLLLLLDQERYDQERKNLQEMHRKMSSAPEDVRIIKSRDHSAMSFQLQEFKGEVTEFCETV